MNDGKKRILQWHSAFFAGLQIELKAEAEKLIFENEHMLSNKPMQVDVLIVKKNSEENIQKNIGQIFRRHNIIEYKSPDDYLSIDDFYKVYGYTCFYKSDTGKTNEIKINELTISFVCNRYPRELIKHLKQERNFEVYQHEKGIYYILNDIFPIQLIITSQLSEDNNLWLKNLTNNIKEYNTTNKLIQEYDRHSHDELYKSIMNVIVYANKAWFEEAKNMCEALRELFKDELEEQLQKGFSNGFSDGIEEGEHLKLLELIQKKISKGKTLAQIADELEETEEAILPLYNQMAENLK